MNGNVILSDTTHFIYTSTEYRVVERLKKRQL